MPFADVYLARHAFVPAIAVPPSSDVGIIVVVPCCGEPHLLRALQSLAEAVPPACNTEVIVVVNHSAAAPKDVKELNRRTRREVENWAAVQTGRLAWHIVETFDIPAKDAGVGLARKTGMDEAVWRFSQIGTSHGVIACFDADCLCDTSYWTAIEACFADRAVNGASIYFEHPVDGDEFLPDIYRGIVRYELHLRYLNQALRYAGFPYAYHTVGSSFAVRASAYVKQGGMNKRKAGEDFHFLHKIIPLGHYVDLNTTCVRPSPRVSARVPFGTGASMGQWLNHSEQSLDTYPIVLFEALRLLFSIVPQFYPPVADIVGLCSALHPVVRDYLHDNDYLSHIQSVQHNCASTESFVKRFFSWFDGLNTVKYLNFGCRYFQKVPPFEAATDLLRLKGCDAQPSTEFAMLQLYRDMERAG